MLKTKHKVSSPSELKTSQLTNALVVKRNCARKDYLKHVLGPLLERFVLTTLLVPLPHGQNSLGSKLLEVVIHIVAKGAEIRVETGSKSKYGISAGEGEERMLSLRKLQGFDLPAKNRGDHSG